MIQHWPAAWQLDIIKIRFEGQSQLLSIIIPSEEQDSVVKVEPISAMQQDEGPFKNASIALIAGPTKSGNGGIINRWKIPSNDNSDQKDKNAQEKNTF